MIVAMTPVLRWNSTGTCVAGQASGTTGSAADQLQYPYALLLDSNMSLFVVDSANNRIQRWSSGATVGVTVAGQASGASGSSSSALNYPVGMAMDSAGYLYFTDRNNLRVMYWAEGASSGTTIAGTTGEIDRLSVGLCLKFIHASTGSAGSAYNLFDGPAALARISSSGTLYIADTYNHRIMQYLSNASSGTVVAGGNGQGNGITQLNFPFCFAFDPSSNSFLISNYGAHTVVRWVLGATSWTLIAGVTGSYGFTSTFLSSPLSVTLDDMKNVYVADSGNHRIQLFLAGQSNASTIAGVAGSFGNAAHQLRVPYWAILDDQLNLFVADTYNHRVQRFQRL